MNIRSALDMDVTEIARILKEAREVAIPYALIPYSVKEIESWVRSCLLTECRVYVMDVPAGDKLHGVAALSDGWLEQLYLDPDVIGQGLGTEFMAYIKAQNSASLSLHCFQKNERARSFYEHHGFELIELRDGSANEEGVPDCLYRWPGTSRFD